MRSNRCRRRRTARAQAVAVAHPHLPERRRDLLLCQAGSWRASSKRRRGMAVSDEYLNFYLYRITVHPSGQLDLFGRVGDMDRRDLLRSAIESEPASSPTEEYRWFLSKASAVDKEGYYLRLGRATRVVITEVDSAGRFYDREDTTVLNTHVLSTYISGVCHRIQVADYIQCKGPGQQLGRRIQPHHGR